MSNVNVATVVATTTNVTTTAAEAVAREHAREVAAAEAAVDVARSREASAFARFNRAMGRGFAPAREAWLAAKRGLAAAELVLLELAAMAAGRIVCGGDTSPEALDASLAASCAALEAHGFRFVENRTNEYGTTVRVWTRTVVEPRYECLCREAGSVEPASSGWEEFWAMAYVTGYGLCVTVSAEWDMDTLSVSADAEDAFGVGLWADAERQLTWNEVRIIHAFGFRLDPRADA